MLDLSVTEWFASEDALKVASHPSEKVSVLAVSNGRVISLILLLLQPPKTVIITYAIQIDSLLWTIKSR